MRKRRDYRTFGKAQRRAIAQFRGLLSRWSNRKLGHQSRTLVSLEPIGDLSFRGTALMIRRLIVPLTVAISMLHASPGFAQGKRFIWPATQLGIFAVPPASVAGGRAHGRSRKRASDIPTRGRDRRTRNGADNIRRLCKISTILIESRQNGVSDFPRLSWRPIVEVKETIFIGE